MKFLVLIDKDGKIQSVKWCLSNGLFVEGQSIFDVFDEESKRKVKEIISEATEDAYYEYTTVILKHEANVAVSLYVIKIENQLVLMGFNNENETQKVFNELIVVYNNFVNKVRKEFKQLITEREDAVRMQFEEIQKLNNELTNTKRKLEKSVHKLNIANSELQSQLVYDSLTGLVSRYQYWSQIKAFIAEKPGKKGVVTFIDLDGFKFVNDTYGHAYGDKLLVEFANRLKKMNMANTIKIRIGGDEFALFTYGLEHIDEHFIQNIWKSISECVLSEPVEIDGNRIHLSVSAGMSRYGIDSEEISELIEFADFAMYQAKRNGKNGYCLFSKQEFIDSKTGK